MIQSGFYVWAAVALGMVYFLLRNSPSRKKMILSYALLVAVWLAYVTVISFTGVLDDLSLPPRLPLLIVIPAIAATLFLTGVDGFRDVLMRTPPAAAVYLQSFRIVVEFLIYGAFLNGVFPERATFAGINYDILVGSSAPLVAFLYQRGKVSNTGLLAWNIISLLILSVTVYAFISTYYFTDFLARGGNLAFLKMPYLLLASVLLPVAVFLHIFSIRQIRIRKRNLINESEIVARTTL